MNTLKYIENEKTKIYLDLPRSKWSKFFDLLLPIKVNYHLLSLLFVKMIET